MASTIIVKSDMNSTRLLAVSESCPPAMLQREAWHIKDFALVKEIGSGAVSCVYYAFCRKSSLRIAIKIYNKAKLTKLNARQVEREIAIHSSVKHPHIVDFYAAFEDEQGIYLLLEYAEGGDLFDAVKRKGGRMHEAALVQQVLYPYLCALMYLHSRGIIHRDIKPENTVFTRDHVLKITDFGLAVNMREERPVTRLGTLDYMAPEVLCCPDKYLPSDNKDRADLTYTEQVDAWAMGVLAYELTVGRPPFGMADREGTMRAITQMPPSMPDWMSAGAANFIGMALEKSPLTRAPVARLVQHPWIAMHTRSGDAMLQQPVSPLRQSLHRTNSNTLHRSNSNSHTSSPLSKPAQSAASLHRLALGVAFSSQAECSTASRFGYGSTSSSFTGAGWQLGASQVQGPIAQAANPDPRPAKRLLQRCAINCNSDSGGRLAARANPEAAAMAKVQAQNYWHNLGPGWGAADMSQAAAGINLATAAATGSSGNLPSSESLASSQTRSSLELAACVEGGLSCSWEGHQGVCTAGMPFTVTPLHSAQRLARSSSFTKRRTPDGDWQGAGAAATSSSPAMQLFNATSQPDSMPFTLDLSLPCTNSYTPASAAGDMPAGQKQQQQQRIHVRSNSFHLPAGSALPSSPTSGGLSHQHQPSRFSKVKRTLSPTSPSVGDVAAELAAVNVGRNPVATLQSFHSLGHHRSAASSSEPLEDIRQQWQHQQQPQLHQQLPSMGEALLAVIANTGEALEPSLGHQLGLPDMPDIAVHQAGLAGQNWLRGPQLQLASHPLLSPYATPMDSPGHTSAESPSSLGQNPFAQQPTDHWQSLDPAAAAGILQVAGLTLSSPVKTFVRDASTSSEESGGLSMPDVIRMLASQDAKVPGGQWQQQQHSGSLCTVGGSVGSLQFGGITHQQQAWQQQQEAVPWQASPHSVQAAAALQSSSADSGTSIGDLRQQSRLVNLLSESVRSGPPSAFSLSMLQGHLAKSHSNVSSGNHAAHHSPAPGALNLASSMGPTSSGGKSGLAAYLGAVTFANHSQKDGLAKERSSSGTSQLNSHISTMPSLLGHGLSGNMAVAANGSDVATAQAEGFAAAARQWKLNNPQLQSWQDASARVEAAGAGEKRPINMDLLLPFLEPENDSLEEPSVPTPDDAANLNMTCLFNGMDVETS